jgi:dihydroorotate dehydrogenase
MYSILKSILFMMDAEKAHQIAMGTLSVLVKIPGVAYILKKLHYAKRNEPFELFGLHFYNRVGLAAGFDKDAKYVEVFQALGFGHIEIGTVTPLAQDGNEKPRLFRVTEDKALVNRMGFNNEGVDAVVERLKKYQEHQIIIGANIGKNKNTPIENAVNDYLICFQKMYDYVDYFTVNVSSPNTPNLRDLQSAEMLNEILSTLQIENKKRGDNKPILLKIAPDLTLEQIDNVIKVVISNNINGIVATNTTIDRSNLKSEKAYIESIGTGGLSGMPLMQASTDIVQHIENKTNGELPIIAVGGIFSKQDAVDKFKAGAELVQLYTGFIYKGPHLIRKINKIKMGQKHL